MDGPAVDAAAIVAFLRLAYGIELREATIRVWASRGRIQRFGLDARGRRLYDLAEVVDRAILDD
jgi:hypothetical protein